MVSNVLPNDIVVDKVRRYYCLMGWLIGGRVVKGGWQCGGRPLFNGVAHGVANR